MIIICTNYDELESPVLHTKFRGNRSTGSGGEDFLNVFTIYGRGGHLGYARTIYTNFGSLFSMWLHIKFGLDWPSGFGGEDVRRRQQQLQRRTPEHGYTISSPMSLWLK